MTKLSVNWLTLHIGGFRLVFQAGG